MTDFLIERIEGGTLFHPKSRAAEIYVSHNPFGRGAEFFGGLFVDDEEGGWDTNPQRPKSWEITWDALEVDGFACAITEGSRR